MCTMKTLGALGAAALLALAPACGDSGTGAADLAVAPDLTYVDKAASCASTFGTALTSGFGRLDGTVLAVVPPGHPTCTRPNGDHLILQVLAGGQAYRMVVNVQSDRAGIDPRVRFAEITAPLAVPPYAEGWRNALRLDYAKTLGTHIDAFTPYAMDDLVARVTDRITVGAPVSVWASTTGGDSAHLIHRQNAQDDGAIVLDPTGPSPKWLLFAFDGQTF